MLGVVLTDFLGPLIGAGVGVLSALGASWVRRRDERAVKVEELLAGYRDPLLGAAYELQSRFYNIFHGRFLGAYYGKGLGVNARYAEESTLWIIGQYFGWTEILRREIQFLDLGDVAQNRRLQARLDDVARSFASDRGPFGRLRVFGAHQRAIGEVMIREASGESGTDRAHCLGFAEFTARRKDKPFWQWFEPLAEDLKQVVDDPTEHERFVAVQRAAVELVDVLDPDRIRYPNPKRRGRLPPRDADRMPREDYFFGAYQLAERDKGVPLLMFDTWAQLYKLRHDHEPGDRLVRKRVGLVGSRLVTRAWCDGRSVQVEAFIEPPRWTRRLRLARSERALKLDKWRWRSWWARRRGRALVGQMLALYENRS